MSSLSFAYKPEDEWHRELCVLVQSGDFSGCSSAWFKLSESRDFAERLGEYPLARPISLVGGYWTTAEPATISETHVSIG